MQFALEEMPYLLRALFAALSTIWVWMFFPPMSKLGLVFGIRTFIPFLLALLVAQWIPYVWVRIIMALAAAQAYIVYHFPVGGVHHSIMAVIHEELLQIRILLRTGHLVEPFQTHLFLVALILIYWLLTYASLRPRLWVFYNALGILVLTIIDGNTNVHPNEAIVVNSLIMFLVLGLSRYAQLRLHFEQYRWPALRYVGPLLAVMLIASGAAWMLPKAPAVWANPFGKFGSGTGNGSGNGNGSGSTQQIGYQENNSHLGGSFVMNYTPVLQVDSKVPVYLRGKVYSDYTGKGWDPGNAVYASVQSGRVSAGPTATLEPKAPTQTVKQTIHVLSDRLQGDTVMGSYSITSMKLVQGNQSPLQVNIHNGDVVGGWNHSGETYTVTSKAVEAPSSELQTLPALPDSTVGRTNEFLNTVGSQYLQVPHELPARVKQLAQKIVKGDTTEYQMVTSVENYLQGYHYQIANVPRPGKNQDYVDQFLFDSQIGYCNNFSTSMAVMLRTVGIPTRWVTGFADGQDTQTSTSSSSNSTSGGNAVHHYIVKESDAHSWVEVYFPQYGWIPFDPTPGFDFPYLANPHPAGSTTSPSSTTPTPSQSPKTGQTPKSTTAAGAGWSIPWQAIGAWTWKALAAVAAFAVLAGLVLRKQVLLRLYMWLWKQETPRGLTRGILKLLSLLKRKGWLGERAATMRDLEPAAVRYGIDSTDFQRLRSTVEQTWYSPEQPSIQELQIAHKTWIQWIRAVIFGKPAKKNKRLENED